MAKTLTESEMGNHQRVLQGGMTISDLHLALSCMRTNVERQGQKEGDQLPIAIIQVRYDGGLDQVCSLRGIATISQPPMKRGMKAMRSQGHMVTSMAGYPSGSTWVE